MDPHAVISQESQRFADVLTGTDPHRICPTCPDWSAADLLWHLTEVHHFWGEILERNMVSDSGLGEVEQSKPDRPTRVADIAALRERATGRLVDQLAAHDDAQPLWSWWPADQTVGFTRRMQTYEATMHRLDAELVAGVDITPIAADVAAGAVDHAVDVMWAWMPDGAGYQRQAVVEVVAADTGRRWFVEAGRWSAGDSQGARALRSAATDVSATVIGTVDDLARWAWSRGGDVHVDGTPDAVAAISAVLAVGM